MKFNKEIIDQIKEANPIESVVQQFMDDHNLPINHSGNNLFFHHHIWRDDPNPGTAGYCTPATQSWYCFSCGKGSDVIGLVQSFLFGDDFDHRNYSQFAKALAWLADRANLPFTPPDEEDEELSELRIIYSIYTDFVNYCYKNSYTIQNAQKTFEMIDERYPLTQETIEKFKICYFDRKWNDKFYEKMREKYTENELVSSGLWQDHKGKLTCFIQNRLVIPYIQHGDVVYLIGRETKYSYYEDENGGRVNFDGGKKFKKLVVFSEDWESTKRISKLVRNDYVFGSDFIKKGQDIIITEGIGDCLVLLQNGHNAISPVTVSFKKEMLEPVSYKLKTVRQVYICNDSETSEAGKNGSIKMYNYFVNKGIDAKIIELPLGEGEVHKDVAEYFSDHCNDDFKQLMESAQSALDLEIDKITPASHKLDVQKIWEKILNLDSFDRDMKTETLAKKLGKRPKALKEWFGDSVKSQVTSKMVFETPSRILPAQCFKFENGGKKAFTTVWIPIEQTKDSDDHGEKSELKNKAYLIESEYTPEGAYNKRIIDLSEEPLTAMDMLRIPDEVLTFDLWRLSTVFPFSVGNFVGSKETLKPDIEAVYYSLYQIFDEYFWYPNECEKMIVSLYIILTYFYQLFPAIPGLHLTGIRGSGKSNALMVAFWTAFNASKVISVKESFLFRSAHQNAGTIIVDEAEQFTGNERSDKNEDVLMLLRSRYKQGDSVPRQTKDANGNFKTSLYETYGPTLIGGIHQLEAALSTRLIIIECLKKEKLEGLKVFNHDVVEIQEKCKDIRDKLYCLMLMDFPKVVMANELNQKDPKVNEIINRAGEIWQPLLAIARWIDMSSKHTKYKLVDKLMEVQKQKEELRRDSEVAINNELVVLDLMFDILVNRKGISATFKVVDIGNNDFSIPVDGFYSTLNIQLKQMSIQRQHDMTSKSDFENVLRKTQVWRIGEGKIDKGRVIINKDRLIEAINRLKAG